MAKRKFRSQEFPKDVFVEIEVGETGVTVETASRFEGERTFSRIEVTLSRDKAIEMIQKTGRDLGLTVTLT